MAAYDYVLRAKDHHHKHTKEDNAKAIEMAQKAIELDPNYSLARAWHSCSLGQALGAGYMAEETVVERIRKAENGLAANSQDDAECHRILTELNLAFHRDFDKVRFHQDRAYALNPNDPRIVSQRGETRMWLGEAAEAIGWIEKRCSSTLPRPSAAPNIWVRRIMSPGSIRSLQARLALATRNTPILPPATRRSAMRPKQRPKPRWCSKAIRIIQSPPRSSARPTRSSQTANTSVKPCSKQVSRLNAQNS